MTWPFIHSCVKNSFSISLLGNLAWFVNKYFLIHYKKNNFTIFYSYLELLSANSWHFLKKLNDVFMRQIIIFHCMIFYYIFFDWFTYAFPLLIYNNAHSWKWRLSEKNENCQKLAINKTFTILTQSNEYSGLPISR